MKFAHSPGDVYFFVDKLKNSQKGSFKKFQG